MHAELELSAHDFGHFPNKLPLTGLEGLHFQISVHNHAHNPESPTAPILQEKVVHGKLETLSPQTELAPFISQ